VQWNVGQGSWSSYIDDQHCVHIDAGGKWRGLTALCKKKKNFLFLTHYDWDHINLAPKIQRSAHHLCRAQRLPNNLSLYKRKILQKIPLCDFTDLKMIRQIYDAQFSQKNESHAFVLGGKFLITGDASKKIEKKWLPSAHLKEVHFLLAGHHGSRTSLAPELLHQTPSLKMIFVSCLKKRYGHPHAETKKKAEAFKLPLLITEHFGTMALEISD
jgi:competence protein ComEC